MRLPVALGMALIWSGAQAQMRIPAVQIAGPPTIDGVLSAGEWDGATHLTGFIDQTNGQPAHDQTEVWLAYDKSCLYVAFKVSEPDAKRVVANATQPGSIGNDDLVEFYVDPYCKGKWETMNVFSCNPKGIQSEFLAGGRSGKREWRGVWQSVAKNTDGGWIAEMRIPWKVMDLPGAGKHDVTFCFRRVQVHSAVTSWLPDISMQIWLERSYRWTDVELPAPQSSRPAFQAYLGPTLEDGRAELTGGIDVRYKLNQRLTALASVNPDFDNIEQAIASIAFTRLEQYLSDNRPFFNEGNGFFNTFDNYGYGFYSRRIADFDLGGKVYGNVGSNDEVGLFFTQGDSDKTNAVLNFTHRYNSRSRYSIYATARDEPGVVNRLTGAQLSYGKGPLTGYAAGAVSFDDHRTRSAGSAAAALSTPKWTSSLAYIWDEPGFNPALGYVNYDDIQGVRSDSSYDEYYTNRYLRHFGASLSAISFQSYDGSNRIQSADSSVSFETKNRAYLSLGATSQKYDDEYERSGSTTLVFYNSAYTNQITLKAVVGERAGNYTSYMVASGRYRLLKKVDVGLSFARQEYLGISEQTIFTIGWTIDPKRTLSARTVYSQGKTNAYLAFKSAGFTGMDWYLIVGDPNALEWKDRIVAKLVWAW